MHYNDVVKNQCFLELSLH